MNVALFIGAFFMLCSFLAISTNKTLDDLTWFLSVVISLYLTVILTIAGILLT